MRKLILLFATVLLFTSAAAVFSADWDIAEDYAVKFSTKKAEGTFSDLQGTVIFDSKNLSSSTFDVSVDVASIQTGNKTKDKHARGKKWLDAENHPRISFVSESFTKSMKGYLVKGKLNIRGTARNESILFTFNPTEEGGLFSGSLTIDRQKYGIEGPFLFGGMVGDEILVELRVPVSGEE